MKLDDVRDHTAFKSIIEVLGRYQIMIALSPPTGPRGAWYVHLYDRATGELGVGRSPNAVNALLLATSNLELAIVRYSQDSLVRNVPDAGDIVAKEAS